MAVLLANNATSRLASSLTAAATTLSVTTGEGAKFPSPTGGDWFPLTLIKSSGALEILRCTARSGDVLTVTRAQEGTAAQAFSAGDRVEVRLTNAVIDDLKNSALLDANNLSDLTNAATARTNLGLGNAATGTVQSSVTDTTPGRLMQVGAGGWLGQAQPGSYISGYPTSQAVNISQIYRRETVDNGVNAHNASIHFAAYDTWGRLRVDYGSPKAWIQGGVAHNGTGWTAELYHTGNISSFAQTLLDDANAEAARGTLDVYSKAEANGIAIGVGQTWQNVTASRSAGVTYTNTTGRPIQIFVTFDPVGFNTHFQINEINILPQADSGYYHVACIIPAGSTYRLGASGSPSYFCWVELR